MPIRSDWHIHTRNSCDEAALTVRDLLAGAAACGISDFGITDHVHTPYNLLDIEAARREFDAACPPASAHFGVEISCVSEWELEKIARGEVERPVYGIREGGPAGAELAVGLPEEERRRLGIEYVVAGVHWPLYVPYEADAITRDYHRQLLFLACHPMVTIIAHPWWWMGRWRDTDGIYRSDPWLDDFTRIPAAMHREFSEAVRANGKAVEINLGAMILNPTYTERFRWQYGEYLAALQSEGVTLSIGSDCHDAIYGSDFDRAEQILERLGIDMSILWRLPSREY
ncbi:MAG: hypothetical protein IT210_20485 [Armatimonadetes bacterium]|nr:hypothetical protein [Armatimonadota bacterium]